MSLHRGTWNWIDPRIHIVFALTDIVTLLLHILKFASKSDLYNLIYNLCSFLYPLPQTHGGCEMENILLFTLADFRMEYTSCHSRKHFTCVYDHPHHQWHHRVDVFFLYPWCRKINLCRLASSKGSWRGFIVQTPCRRKMWLGQWKILSWWRWWCKWQGWRWWY